MKVITIILACILLSFTNCSKDEFIINEPFPVLGDMQKEAKDSLNKFFFNPVKENLLIRNVNLVDIMLGSILTSQDIYISDGRIENIVSSGSTLKDGYKLIDGTNKYLTPGYSDMHAHVYPGSDLTYDLFLFLAKGVTNIRVMWGSGYHIALRDSISKGQKLGPRMYVASAGFDGQTEFWPGSVITQSNEDVRMAIDNFKEKGFDYIKVYSNLPKGQYLELASYSKQQGIPFIGHIPNGVDWNEVITIGQLSIEHFDRFGASANNEVTLLEETAAMGVFVCPTLTVLSRVRSAIPSYRTSWYDYVSPAGRSFFSATESHIPSSNSLFARNKSLTLGLQNANGKILSGTDTGIRYVLPGASLHEELDYYYETGLSPIDVLRTTTTNVSDYLDDPKIGTISIDSYANVVLLNNNPLADIKNGEDISGIVVNGQWISGERINEILKLLKAYYNH